MKALTVWEPWATAIALGWKPVENRTWPTKHRGALAIHASKRPPDNSDINEVLDIIYGVGASDVRPDTFAQRRSEFCTLLERHLGKVLAVVDVTGMLRNYVEAGEALKTHRFGDDFYTGDIGWHVENPRRLSEPVACRGAQGLWELPADVERQVLALL